MKTTLTAILLTACITLTGQAQLKKVYDETVNPMEQIDRAIAEAQAGQKFVICQVGGNWCPWCLRFAEFAANDSVIAPLMKENYVYIHVNYSKQNKNLEAMKYLGNPGRFGYPAFVVLNEEGTPIHIQESESLEEGKGYSRKRVEKFLRLWNRKAVEAEVK